MHLHESPSLGGILVALALAHGGCSPAHRPGAPLLVAAASDLTVAFDDLASAWARAGHPRPTVTFGSSGLLATQITQGAPFDVFASANLSFAREAVHSGRCDGATLTHYARGRVALCSRGGRIHSLSNLADPGVTHVAIANPEHAPYGRAAREALTTAGLWEAVHPKLVYGENVQQTLQFVQSGNADVALVSQSLAMTSGLACTVIDKSLHHPIDQVMVACGHGPHTTEARAFVAFVSSPAGRSILARHGFAPPMASDGGE